MSVSRSATSDEETSSSSSDGIKREEKPKKTRPDSRWKTKKEPAAQYIRVKRLKLAEQMVHFLKRHVEELNHIN